MSTKVKGLFRGLRYISQIFDEKEEDEIQIGFPTDVKHVAHIGMDGPSANTPTWMNEFKTASEVSQPASAPVEAPVDSVETQGDGKTSKDSKRKAKHIPKSRHGSLESNNTDSPTRGSSDGSKHVRRHRSSDPTSECSARDSPSSGTRQSRKGRSSNPGSDSQAASKPGRRRKAKTTSIDDTERPERSSRRSSKGDSMSDISLPDLDAASENGHERKNSE
ncbi:CRIB domain-containing protein RIC10-like [Neltuma alba]|uniref:CRIB domain-containing protein RIC10-like n=1 Tax=Neltuma alba TaxID=207710 RepID=UPI0010A2D3E1|nr:CRIB domain-containing protein RIC10-like [Prosopis alba]XP_028769632.1 CRIB domain-containing protein RIC10-like [Prosopis alba]XP_028769633.1 CRIB domain-containing protein RIC10-like [Prosopis alba]